MLKEAWDGGQEFKSFYQCIFNNLHEDTESEKTFLNHQASHSQGQFYESLGFQKKPRYHLKWNIRDSDIKNELDRQGQNDVSFIFILKWFDYDFVQKKRSSNILKYIAQGTDVSIS